jgi:hypothetical protein
LVSVGLEGAVDDEDDDDDDDDDDEVVSADAVTAFSTAFNFDRNDFICTDSEIAIYEIKINIYNQP